MKSSSLAYKKLTSVFTCRQCKNKFETPVRRADWGYKIGGDKEGAKMFCTYSCMRKWEKELHEKKDMPIWEKRYDKLYRFEQNLAKGMTQDQALQAMGYSNLTSFRYLRDLCQCRKEYEQYKQRRKQLESERSESGCA